MLKKVTHYAQYYAHDYCNYTSVFIIFDDYISIVGLQMLSFILCYAAILKYSIYYAHEKLVPYLDQVAIITVSQKLY